MSSREAPSAVLTLGNRFGFATIAVTMEYSDEDSDYPEAPNEVNDENQNSPSYNAIDVPADTNGVVINDGTIVVISKFCSEAYTDLPICPSKLLLSSFLTVCTESSISTV
jgi:hypothetical protein